MSKDLEFKTYKGKIVPFALFTSIFQTIITIVFTNVAFNVEIDGEFLFYTFIILLQPIVWIFILIPLFFTIKFLLTFDSKSTFHSLKEKKLFECYKLTLLGSILIFPLSLKISSIHYSISLLLLLYLYFIIFKEYEKNKIS